MKWRRGAAVCFLGLAFACRQNRTPAESVPGDAATTAGGDGGMSTAGGTTSDAAVPGGPEVVYERGPQRPLPLEADETHLYWGESGDPWRILRAPKSGAGPVEEVGPWAGVEVVKQVIVVDATHVYWLDKDVIRKVDKHLTTASALSIGPPPLAGGWAMIGHEDFLYFSDRECTAVARIAKSGGEPTYYKSTEHNGTGGTVLAIDSDGLYCGSGPDLLRFPKQGGMATKLVTVAEGERVGPLVSSGSSLFWATTELSSACGKRTWRACRRRAGT